MAALMRRLTALGPRARLFAGLLALAGLGAVALALALQRDSRVPLFARALSADQVAEVTERLAAWNVGFVATADNVRVEAKRRNEVLLQLALAGLPHAHLETTAEVLAKANPLTPQSVLDAQQRDGLAGDLASGLRGIAGIDDARVIIAPAEPGTFADDTAHVASASVWLRVTPGTTLRAPVLAGIRQFVAAGVSGLDPKRVAVLDDRGVALGEPSGGGAGDEAASFAQSLQSALDLALGAAATIVRVRVSYDSRVREVHEVIRKPLGSRAIGTTTSDESYKSTSKTYAKRSATVDRGSDVADERIDTPAGRLERISVAVAVDRSRHLEVGKIRSLAIGTLGLVPERGDVVRVEEVAFPAPPLARPSRYAPLVGWLALLAPSLALALAVVVAARFGAKPTLVLAEGLARRLDVQRAGRSVAGFPAAHVRGVLAAEPPHTAAAIISALPAATAAAVLELYPAEERAAIVRRLARSASPVVPDYETVLRRG